MTSDASVAMGRVDSADRAFSTTSGVSMDVRVDTGGFGSMIRGGTGELLQMAFGGQGYVLVQPSESVTEGGHQGGGMLGQLLS